MAFPEIVGILTYYEKGVLAGTLNEQTVGSAPRFTLTEKEEGKTRCLYVPVAMAPKVRRMTANWKERRMRSTTARRSCGRPQGMWGRKICEALHYYDCSKAELETVYLNHEYEGASRSTS